MKKLIAVIALLFACQPVYAGALSRGAERIESLFSDSSPDCPACQCSEVKAICPGTPFEKITRPSFELGLYSDALVFPSNGDGQFNLENYRVVISHNLSPVLFGYISASMLTADKIDYEDTPYEQNWDYKILMAGIGMYFTPVVKIFGGIGYISPENDAGAEELSTPWEWGIALDIPIKGYVLVVSWRSITAPLDEDTPSALIAPANASMNVASVGLNIPVNGL